MEAREGRVGRGGLKETSSILASGIGTEYVEEIWPLVEETFEEVFDKLGYQEKSLESIKEDIKKCKSQLFCTFTPSGEFRAFLLTSISDWDYHRVLTLEVLGGGDERDWRILEKTCREFAKSQKCDIMRVEGRLGWSRKLEPLGYKEMARIYVRRLDNG